MNRRELLKRSLGSALACGGMRAWLSPRSARAETATRPASGPAFPEARAVTRGPKHHFFGYYDKCPWDATGRHLLAMEIDFIGRNPRKGEPLTVGMVDLRRGDRFIPLDATLAWSWQQGTMLQWLGSASDREVIYNSLDGDHYISVIRDVHEGRTRTLPRPVYDVSLDGRQAVTLDFERVNRLRPGYGYVALPERTEHDPAPKDAGIYWMDLATGRNKQILSLDWAAHNQRLPEFDGAHHWFNHLKFNPSGTRFLFLHRWRPLSTMAFGTRLYTAGSDGGDVRLLSRSISVSHFDWRDDETILAWTSTKEQGAHFYLIDDRTGRYEVVAGGVLKQDGHCSYSPDRKWVLVDTYPDKQRRQHLMLYRPADNRLIEIGSFEANAKLSGPFRCDLHPRWNRDGTQVCFDGSHDGTRQMYVVDVKQIVRA
jgi:hypothetical protein